MKWLQVNRWFVLVIIVIFAAFYWFQVRPSQIRSQCVDEADVEQSVAYPPLTQAEWNSDYQRGLNYQGLAN